MVRIICSLIPSPKVKGPTYSMGMKDALFFAAGATLISGAYIALSIPLAIIPRKK